MSTDETCPDCGEVMDRMELQGTDLAGELTIVDPASDDGFLSGARADEILTPVPYVCPDCRRTVLYAED